MQKATIVTVRENPAVATSRTLPGPHTGIHMRAPASLRIRDRRRTMAATLRPPGRTAHRSFRAIHALRRRLRGPSIRVGPTDARVVRVPSGPMRFRPAIWARG
jgi:hypothetical protein